MQMLAMVISQSNKRQQQGMHKENIRIRLNIS